MRKNLLVLTGVTFLILFAFTSCKKNVAPVVSAVTVAPASVSVGGTATVSVTATDEDSDPLTYSYVATGGSIAGAGATATWTAPAVAGTYTVTVTVSDDNDGSATGTGTLIVTEAATITQVTGTASFPAGTSGDLSNSKVSLYTSYENWNANQPIKFATAQGSGASVSFNITGVNPGNYYIDVWKDNDNDGVWGTTGDFVGWYGSGGLGSPSLTEFQVAEGQTVNLTISMFIAKKGTYNK